MKKNWTLIAGFLILEFLNFEQAFCQTTMPVEAKIFKALVDCNNPPNIICAPDFHGCPGGKCFRPINGWGMADEKKK